MYIERVPNRSSPSAILLRESFRKDGKVCKRTILNLTKWPPQLIEGLRVLLKGGIAISDFEESFAIVRSQPYGHVAATLGVLRKLGLDTLLDARRSRSRDIACALIVAQVLRPLSKGATSRALDPEALVSSFGTVLGIGSVTDDDLRGTMEWLLERQSAIEARLVKRHLGPGRLALAYVGALAPERNASPHTGRCAGHGEKAMPETVFGLLCNAAGCPVAVRVFEGESADPGSIGADLDALRRHFGLERVALVGDHGLPVEAESLGFDWITSVRRPGMRQLVATGVVEPNLIDQGGLAEISNSDRPGERLVLWRDPDLAQKRARCREGELRAVEARLEVIAQAVRRERDPSRGAGEIGLRVGMAIRRRKLAKCFELRIGEGDFSYARKAAVVAAEAALDGVSGFRTSLSAGDMSVQEVIKAHRGIGRVEQAFRRCQTGGRTASPNHDRIAGAVRAQGLLCMLAYYVEWHMRAKLAPMLSVEQSSALTATADSASATQGEDEGCPVHSFGVLLENLSTITCNWVEPKLGDVSPFEVLTRPTELQQRALELLEVKLG